jgi:hypothetical protein
MEEAPASAARQGLPVADPDSKSQPNWNNGR